MTTSYITHPVQRTESYPMGDADGSHLSDFERDVLARIPSGTWGLSTPSALIVYRGEFGLEMGAVRCRYSAGYAGRTEDSYEISPFPGAWERVTVSRILLVRPQTI